MDLDPVVLVSPYDPPPITATVLPCDGTGAPDAVGVLAAALPVPQPPISAAAGGAIRPRAVGTAHAALPLVVPPAPVATFAARQSLDLPGAEGPGIRTPAATVPPMTACGARMAQQQATPTRTASLARQQQAAPLAGGLAARAAHMPPASRRASAPHQHGLPRSAGSRHGWAERLRARRKNVGSHQQAGPLSYGTRHGWSETGKPRRRLRAGHTHGIPHSILLLIDHDARGVPVAVPIVAPWAHGLWPPPGRWWPSYEAPPLSGTGLPPCHPNYVPRPLRCPVLLGPRLPAQPPCPVEPPGAPIVVPLRSAYLVLNTVSLVRAADGVPLTAAALALQIDVDSWCWGWEATLPGAELALVEPLAAGAPVELIATVNGEQFRVLAERIARDRRFGESRLRISGRGRAAMLASPHSPVVTRDNTGDRTMQQLLADALTTNGVPLGWAIDWQAADWLVPAGAWSHTGSYMEHAQRLAEAAGAYVQADPLADTLRVLPRYPLLPWEWAAATPDIELPSAPVVREAIEWLERPAYNAVYVSGTQAGGILGHVRRAGTAGDVVAPMVTDALVTHADAARARGRTVLADTGRQARVTLELPILPETGIIKPGRLVRYADAGTARLGLVRSTAVRATLPAARQTIELETHA